MTVSVQQAQPLMLECIVSGSPAPAARWFKNGKEVAPGPSHQRQHNNLAFAAVVRSDEGSYTCAAETEQGTVTSANYTVNILGKINKMEIFGRAWTVCSRTRSDVDVSGLSSTEPVFVTEGLSNQIVPSGSSARFTCMAKGNPSPNITWLFNAEPIAPSHRFRISGSSLVINDVTSQDEGVFQCLLDNRIGTAQSSGMLTIQSGTYRLSYLGRFSFYTTRRSNG